MEAYRPWRAVPADRASPVLFQALCLDVAMPDLHRPNKAKLEKAMKVHVLAHAELIGTYQRHR